MSAESYTCKITHGMTMAQALRLGCIRASRVHLLELYAFYGDALGRTTIIDRLSAIVSLWAPISSSTGPTTDGGDTALHHSPLARAQADEILDTHINILPFSPDLVRLAATPEPSPSALHSTPGPTPHPRRTPQTVLQLQNTLRPHPLPPLPVDTEAERACPDDISSSRRTLHPQPLRFVLALGGLSDRASARSVQQIEDCTKAHFWEAVLSLESVHRLGAIREGGACFGWPGGQELMPFPRLMKPARPGETDAIVNSDIPHPVLIVQGVLGLACANAHAATTIMIALDTCSSRSCTQCIPRPECVPPGTAQSVREPHPAQLRLGTRQPASQRIETHLVEEGRIALAQPTYCECNPSFHAIPSSRGAPAARPPPMATISFPPSPTATSVPSHAPLPRGPWRWNAEAKEILASPQRSSAQLGQAKKNQETKKKEKETHKYATTL
ncbi:hypothetical protein B0H14DRAFT_2606152 [Mycena olivaceomarginata]|nr:hypothetical protein B0H14DRAFT_2606152 [Mycena olivaceomarginata]